MNKVTINPDKNMIITMAQMKPGQFGKILSDSLLFYRTYNCCVCLNNPERSYTGNANFCNGKEHEVVLLPKGTEITIEIQE